MTDEITQNPVSVEAPSETAVEMPQTEAPVVVVPEPAPTTPEPLTAQMGGNEPFTPAPIETQPTPTPTETPAVMTETVPVETITPEPPEVTLTEKTQPTPAEPMIETMPTPTQVVASVVTPVVAPVIAQTFTKSIRELFTKAQLAIQNRKRRKLDHILTLFAK